MRKKRPEDGLRANRRTLLKGLGTGAVSALAGCSSLQSSDDDTDGHSHSSGEDATGEYVRGGQVVMGSIKPPQTLNLLKAHAVHDFDTIGAVYDLGTVNHPETGRPVPWMIDEWEVYPENIGTSKPTVTIHLQEEIRWNDGKKVTAEDIKFTIDYANEQQPRGTLSAKEFTAVEEVTYDKPGGRTVHFFFSRPDNAWSTQIVGNAYIPKHQWKDIPNYWDFEPETPEELIGSGPMRMTEIEWDDHFTLEMRSPDVIPWPDLERIDWLHDDAPFIDSVRIEIFDSEDDLARAVLDGDIDLTNQTVGFEAANEAKARDDLTLKKSHAHGWDHHSFNLRRVPFDCPAFRQLLVSLYDWEYVIEELGNGFGASRGSYASPKEFTEWRPPEPTEIDEYEGIPVPDLAFPGEQGTFTLGEDGVGRAREFLIDHDRAIYEYSLGEAVTAASDAPDGKELYVDGVPLSEAHTDNDGNAGQGPLEMSYTTEEKITKASVEAWMGALQRVGIPIEPAVTEFSDQIETVFVHEDFDVFEAAWQNITVSNTHYWEFFGSEGADLDGTSSKINFNPTGYTGIEDLIASHRERMTYEERRPFVKRILAAVWNDAPTLVTRHQNVLQPVSNEYVGWIHGHGGVNGRNSWLNVRKRKK